MQYLLDVVGSSIIAGFVLLLIMQVNFRMNESSQEMVDYSVLQRESVTVNELIEYDFYKMGYGSEDDEILNADSTEIKFLVDIENNGVVDTVYYFLGDTTEAYSTQNPKDRPLYRKVNSESAQNLGNIVELNYEYFNSTGNIINYGSLNSQTVRNNIHALKVYIRLESRFQVNGFYQSIELEKDFYPRNI